MGGLGCRIQGVVRDMVQVDKSSVSNTAQRLLEGRTPGGDTLEKFGKLDKNVQKQKEQVDTMEKELQLLKDQKEQTRLREGDTSDMLKEYDKEIRSLEGKLKSEQGRLNVLTKGRDKTLGGYTFAQLMELYKGNEKDLQKLVEMSVQNKGTAFLREQKANTDLKTAETKGTQNIAITKGGDVAISKAGDQNIYGGSKDVKPANASDYQVGAGMYPAVSF